MSKLISGKEALIALANGEDVQQHVGENWVDMRRDISWRSILGENYSMRLKPKTITINGIEVPAPFKPKGGDEIYFLYDDVVDGYNSAYYSDRFSFYGYWRTEDEIKQVVAALRTIFKGE